MIRLGKINLFIYIVICLLSLELVLQIAALFSSLKIKKQHLTQKGDFNILCVGDSFTYGLEVSLEESYPRQLESILNKVQQKRHINVINLSISGYNSSQCLGFLEAKFDFYNPKIILVMAGMNNCWNFVDSSYFQIKQFRYSNPLNFRMRFIDALLCRLRTYKLIKVAFIDLMCRLKSNQLQGYQGCPLPQREFKAPLRSDELIELLKEGLRYFEEGKYDLSEVYYRKALELAPDDYQPHRFMGRLYVFKGQREKAEEELISAVKHAPLHEVAGVLNEIKGACHQPKDSKEVKKFADLLKELRSYLVEKFGEEDVRRLIDPIILCEKSDLVKILVYDLTEMANYVRQKKATMVILTYPYSLTKVQYPEDIYHRISNYLDLPLVDNVSLFNKYLKIYRYEELFSDKGGHCTAKGYKLIAENVFDVLKKHNLLPLE